MNKGIGWYANRIARMDSREIIWRCTSFVGEIAEGARILSGTVPQASGALPAAAFKAQQCPASEYRDALNAEQLESLRDYADLLLSNGLTFFGKTEHLGEPVDWHRDWHQGLVAPQHLAMRIDYRDAPVSGDCKEVWEPNRHHQLVVLGRAYHAFGDERYAEKVVELLQSWLSANPYGYGMNWRSPLELAIRLINWVWALDLIAPAAKVSVELSEQLHNSAFLHCRDLARKSSQGSSANNHLIGEAAGLFIAGSYWFAERHPEWLSASKAILEKEITAQQYPSGCTREQALNYQFFVIQFFTLSGLVGEWTDNGFENPYWQALGRYYDFVAQFEPFGTTLPLFGDQDDGYVLDLGHDAHDLHDYAAWAQALAGNPQMGHGPSKLLLHGRYQAKLPPPKAATAASSECQFFEDAGYALLIPRDAHRWAVLLDAGELGYGAMAAHGHADALHLSVAFGGSPVFVDSGTYDYFTYPELREYFRSTAAHNTVRLDGQEQSTMAGPFMWSAAAAASLGVPAKSTDDTAEQLQVRGVLTRYVGLENKFRGYTRTLSYSKERGALQITDALDVTAATLVEHFFHIHPDVEVAQLTDHHYQLITPTGQLQFFVDPAVEAKLVRDGKLASFSPRYHQLAAGACIQTRLRAPESCSFQFELVAGSQA